MSGDLLDAKAYTLNGILEPISTGKPTRNERRESRFQMSSAPCPLPTYHSELDRNLVNHFQKPIVRQTLQSKKFQRMLPGIDHELKMEMNPPLEYPERYSRGMFKGKQGGNTSYAQPKCYNGVRQRVFKDAYHVADVDGRLQPKSLHQEKVREVVRLHSPRQHTTRATAKQGMSNGDSALGKTTDLSMVSNTAFGIRNETHASPFLRKLKGGVAGRPQAEVPPSRPDSVRSEDFIATWQSATTSRNKSPDHAFTHNEFIEVSKKYPPHMQHHHHYGWSDAHISTSLYKPRNVEAKDAKSTIQDQDHAVHYIDNVRTTHTSISRCPTTNVVLKKFSVH